MAVQAIQTGKELRGLPRRAYGLAEVAASFGCSTDSLGRLAKTGDLRTIRILGRVLIPADEVDRIARDGLQIRRGRPPKRAAGASDGAAAGQP